MKVVLASMLLSGLLSAQNITGDWRGILKTGVIDLRLQLHITKDDAGALKACLDSVDQGIEGIPANSVELQGSSLKLSLASIHGAFQGTLNPKATEIQGTWDQGSPLPLTFERGSFAAQQHDAAKPSDIDGAWLGTLDLGAVKLRVVFHFVNTTGGLTATFDSPDQGAKGLPVTSVTRDGASLKLEMKGIGATFEGKTSTDLQTISGAFTQMGNATPLTLSRVKDTASLEHRRPQNPSKPYPYREEEVSYDNHVQNVRLAATLTLPPGKGPFPAVLLITGSGPQDRDESLMDHKPFLVLADHLTRNGIAVLRADDRGTGASTGNFATATTADFATDAEAGIAYLKTRTEVDSHRIGLIGHSEGGVIAPMIAARNTGIAFIVMLAGTGVRGDEIIPAQQAAIAQAAGADPANARKDADDQRDFLLLSEKETDNSVLEAKLRELTAGKMPDAQIAAEIKQVRSPWFQYFLQYDPAPALAKVHCPVLALNGSKDLQVLPSQNLPAIRRALASNKHAEIVELPGLNHLFQTAQTGSPLEYASIEETMAPAALDKISAWILSLGTSHPPAQSGSNGR